MIWGEYVDQCVDKLVECRDKEEFRKTLVEISNDVANSTEEESTKTWFWKELKKRFNTAPKLMLKEAAAAAKLIALMNAAEDLLNAAKSD